MECGEINVQLPLCFDSVGDCLVDIFGISKAAIYDQDEYWTLPSKPPEPHISVRLNLTGEDQFASFITLDCYPYMTKSILHVGSEFQKKFNCIVAVPWQVPERPSDIPWDGSLAVFYPDGRKFSAYSDESSNGYRLAHLKEVEEF